MKYLIMCEGPNEKKVMDILLEHNKLIVTADDLIGREVYHARQIKTSPVVKTQLSMYVGEVEIWRVGDKQSDTLFIPTEMKKQIKKITKYCTLPELEVLLIISESKYKEYEKTKAQKHPKQFAKENISFHKQMYNGMTKFYEEYYGNDVEKLVKSIQEYKKRNHSHSEDQHYLLEILRSD